MFDRLALACGKPGTFCSVSGDDAAWLAAGRVTFERGVNAHFGSPETLSVGGEDALRNGDTAAALFYFAKAIDVAQTWSGSDLASSRSLLADEQLFRQYVDVLETVRSSHPDTDLIGDSINNNGSYTANMMVSISKRRFRAGEQTDPLDLQINRLLTVTGMPVPPHW